LSTRSSIFREGVKVSAPFGLPLFVFEVKQAGVVAQVSPQEEGD